MDNPVSRQIEKLLKEIHQENKKFLKAIEERVPAKDRMSILRYISYLYEQLEILSRLQSSGDGLPPAQ